MDAEQVESQGKKGVAVRPAHGQHPESFKEFVTGVVKNFGQQFDLLTAVVAEQGIIENQHGLAVDSGQFIDLPHKPAHKNLEKLFPVEMAAIEKTVGRILAKVNFLMLGGQRSI